MIETQQLLNLLTQAREIIADLAPSYTVWLDEADVALASSFSALTIKDQKSWQTFRDNGLLFLANNFLHTFGYAIVITTNDDNQIINVVPTRTSFRGFPPETIQKRLTQVYTYLNNELPELLKDLKDE